MPDPTMIFLVAFVLLGPVDWSLPPLVPGADHTVQIPGPRCVFVEEECYREFRYRAMHQTEVTFRAEGEEQAALSLSVRDLSGSWAVEDDVGLGTGFLEISWAASKGTTVVVRVGSLVPEETASIKVSVEESRPLPSWRAEADATKRRLEDLIDSARSATREGNESAREQLLAEMVAVAESSRLTPVHSETLRRAMGVAQGLESASQSLRLARHQALLAEGPWDSSPAVTTARQELADQWAYERQFFRANELYERCAWMRERQLAPSRRAELLAFHGDLAATMRPHTDRLPEAATLLREALRDSEAANLDPDTLARLRINLATNLHDQGLFAESRSVHEHALQELRRHDPHHPHVANLLHNLAGQAGNMGDYATAASLFEEALAIPTDHWDPSQAFDICDNLALCATATEDYEAAKHWIEEAEARVTLNSQPPRLLVTRAVLESRLGNHRRAKELRLQALAQRPELSASSGRTPIPTYAGLVDSCFSLGEHDEVERYGTIALELLHETTQLPEVVGIRAVLARSALLTNQRERCDQHLDALLSAVESLIRQGPIFAPTELQRILTNLEEVLAEVFLLLDPRSTQDPISRRHLNLIETLRGLPAEWQRLRMHWKNQGVSKQDLQELRQVRTQLEQRLARQPADEDEQPSSEIVALVQRRDAVERRLYASAAERPQLIDLDAIARRLAADETIVTYRWHVPRHREPFLVAMVFQPGAVTCHRLPGKEISQHLTEQRRGILKRLNFREAKMREAEERLSRTLLGNLLDLAAPLQRIHVVPHGPLHLLPWESLPVDGSFLGERAELFIHSSLHHFPRRRQTRPSDRRFLLVGGVEFGPPIPSGPQLRELPFSLSEAKSIQQWSREHSGPRSVLLAGSQASSEAFLREAEQATILHLATHGFASSLPGSTVPGPLGSLVPLGSCGVAFAGANGGDDHLGQRTGLVSGETIAGRNLSHCELAVLSACETHVGSLNPGDTVHSLQTAFHAAGVESIIASRWTVDDRATAELFSAFYRLWLHEGFSKREALQEAKKLVREDPTHPEWTAPYFWAGWVLTGDGS